ncbi:Methyl-accepting chemotaxis protein I serine chemoreceptor protein (plasmid) [Paraburkholderia caribensis MBA4]|uniref:Methyl-accepting chemotaxis protein I serine chemoreceptor protein n=1 Tax=Paraburkholderia caribensis MBA4 TaxID=1323664 RepID=A0A0N7JVZ2_9BURK|nr:methyl-accepting chemotaxis protein [Paraburkholderia caribensis]ALL70565.1 Methyl-accepting chemotaxis protein I serine chemoreceptor protein [Paraburkholderia caribensis MBA4]
MRQLFSTVRAKIILVLTTGMVVTVLVGVFGLHGMSDLSGSLQDTYNGNVVPIVQVAKVRNGMQNVRLLLWRMQAQHSGEFIPKVRDMQAQTKSDWNEYYGSGGISSPAERAIADKANALIPQFQSAVEKELQLIERGDFGAAGDFQVGAVAPVGDTLSELITRDFDVNATQARDTVSAGQVRFRQLTWTGLVTIAVGILLSFGAAIFLIRVVTHPLVKTVQIAGDISQGRLDGQIVVDAAGEFGSLLEAMKTMSEKLATTVRGIHNSSESVTVAAGQIAAGNLDLSARTEEQASSLEETAASMTELTETVRQNAENARQANSLARNARDMTDAGSDAVVTMVTTISEISADSAKIADITGMIEGIAFQTNILALNAAVEAARAGEQGRGFAVVAGEVRALAQRASSAAKEIKDLIEASSAKVQRGAVQANTVSDNMGQVSRAIGRMSDIVGEIAAASDEQSKGIAQVHQAITQIDEVTQQNAALVEQSAAAAQSLQEQAARMKEDVGFFRVAGDAAPSTSRAQPSRAVTKAVVPLKPKATVAVAASAPRAAVGGNPDRESF